MAPVSRWLYLFACWLAAAAVAAMEVTVRAPLTTIIPAPGPLAPGAREISAIITVPEHAPADLGVGAYLTDQHGQWWQRLDVHPLRPGTQRVRIAFGPGETVTGGDAAWSPVGAATAVKAGLFIWSTGADLAPGQRTTLTINNLTTSALNIPTDEVHRLVDLTTSSATIACGERWSLQLRPQSYPANPYDPGEFSLTLVVTRPDGRVERVNGFHEQPMRTNDRGDMEEVLATDRGHFTVRYRPRLPGVHHLQLQASWGGGEAQISTLPDLTVSGAAVDPYVRIDRQDPRFFSIDGKFWWPVGPNLRSLSDPRSQENLGTKATPTRGTLAYEAYFARLAAAGVNCVEIWMSSWNLALEWRGDWPGYHGLGRYHEGHAWQLDRILDLAWAHGIRVNLTLNNHGQGSSWVDSEWENNPLNRQLGGPLSSPRELLNNARALADQDRLRRYLAARYADHPAIMAWKLWSEVDFVGEQQRRNADVPLLVQWHEQAAARWRAYDPYGHPVTTHWSSNWTRVDQPLAATPGVQFLCFNLYHNQPGEKEGWILADLLQKSIARKALGQYGKPLLCTEYGGQFNACPPPQLAAEHSSGAFCGLVGGLAGAPMLWWYEWIDQDDRFAPYVAIRRFLAGEDLRDPKATSVALVTNEPEVWARAWARPGHALGYLLDLEWQTHGTSSPVHAGCQITIGQQVAPGSMTVAWWDADSGRELSRQTLTHTGGALIVAAPTWRRHLAFKLSRK